jgi:hypothetical protein
MKGCLYLLFAILTLVGCKDTKKDKRIEPSNTDFSWPLDNFRYASEISVSHVLSLGCGGEYLPVRKRTLNKSEIAMSNSGSEQAKSLNDSLILAYVYNDYPLELVDESSEYYKIRFDYKSQILEGYILKYYCGKPTIKPFTDIPLALRSSNLIINPELMPYCRVFVSEKFHNLLSAGIKSQNPLKHLKKILSETDDELILYSLFVGQSSRELYYNNNRMGGDEEHLFYCIKNEYYTYDFNNWSNMFVVTSPSLPLNICKYSIENDTLKFKTDDFDSYHSKPGRKLYPLDKKRSYTSRKGAVWIMNDSIRLIDISYIADKFSVPESQIGHTYFYEILELYIQEILPKRNDTYLEHYLDD